MVEAAEFEPYIVIITEAVRREAPIEALTAYGMSSESGVPTALAKHPKYGWAVIWTAGQGPAFAWKEKQEVKSGVFDLAFTKEELLGKPPLTMSEKIAKEAIENCNPLKRGQVWCFHCGRTMKVDSGKCFQSGWPTCCKETMSLDSPEERASRCEKCSGTGSITKPVDGRFREPEPCPDCEKYRAHMEES